MNRSTGYRERELDMRVGTVALALSKLREGTCHLVLDNRRRAERAKSLRTPLGVVR